jgi:hypothetical protein
MAGEPVLGKHPPEKRDYRPLTWARIRRLRAWAQKVAQEEKASVYLVGSALTKSRPRDVDVAVVWPVAEFESRFGKLPAEGGTPEMNAYIHRMFNEMAMHAHYAQEAVNWKVRVDVRFCPDSWWPEKDRLLLAAPGDLEGRRCP